MQPTTIDKKSKIIKLETETQDNTPSAIEFDKEDYISTSSGNRYLVVSMGPRTFPALIRYVLY